MGTSVGTRLNITAPAPPLLTAVLDALFCIGFSVPFIPAGRDRRLPRFFKARSRSWTRRRGMTGRGSKSVCSFRIPLFTRLVVDGIWKGVCSVVQFLRRFSAVPIHRDSEDPISRGAALIADRHHVALRLQGRVFIPLLSAYACAVPGLCDAHHESKPPESRRY